MSRYIEYICTTRGVPMCTLASREPRAASREGTGAWRALYNGLLARLPSSVLKKFGLPTIREMWIIFVSLTTVVASLRPNFLFRQPPPGRDWSATAFFNTISNIFKTCNTVSFKELHPLLLVSTPFQTNKINIRLSVIFIKLILLDARGICLFPWRDTITCYLTG